MAKKTTPEPTPGTSQWNMRMPNDMKAQLLKEAKAARRDLTGQILYLLETHPERPSVNKR